MNDTNLETIYIALGIIGVVLAITLPAVYYNLEQDKIIATAIQKQIDSGVDPIKARCSLEKRELDKPVCAIAADKK